MRRFFAKILPVAILAVLIVGGVVLLKNANAPERLSVTNTQVAEKSAKNAEDAQKSDDSGEKNASQKEQGSGEKSAPENSQKSAENSASAPRPNANNAAPTSENSSTESQNSAPAPIVASGPTDALAGGLPIIAIAAAGYFYADSRRNLRARA